MADVSEGTPHPGECLVCFLERMLQRFGCDGSLRWTIRWRRANAPRMRGLENTLRAQGGYCDCEVVTNVFAVQQHGLPSPVP